MRPWHVFVSLIGFFALFFVGLALWFSSEGEVESTVLASRTQSSMTKSMKDDRMEPSQITSKLNKVEDEPSALMNDPAMAQAWGLKKADAGRAWSVSKGSKDLKACIIDTGIDANHEDLKANLWNNPGETGKDAMGHDKATNGIDDDGNGYVDDVHGWNFVASNNDLTDNHGHGTHIAGIIGAEAGNGKGIAGIAPEVSLIVAKYYDPKVPNADNLKNTVASIKYCVAMGADVINYSGGGTEYSQEEHDAVQSAELKGILFVAAAGNERSNSDQHHYYPADYKLKNIISVTAIDPKTEVLSSSNYGTETVDIAAPGQNILSSLPGNTYGFMTGTSQATAFVTGAAILVMAHNRSFKAEDVKKYILNTGDAMTTLVAKTRNSRQLNLYKALTILDSGVGASGVVETYDSKKFPSDPNAALKDPSQGNGVAAGFGHSLMNALQDKGHKTERLGSKTDGDL